MKKEQVPTEYGPSPKNSNSNKTPLSELQMKEPRDYKISINSDGNYEATRYNSQCKMNVTLEFLGTEDTKEISDHILEILSRNFLERNFKNYVDEKENTRYTPTPILRKGGNQL